MAGRDGAAGTGRLQATAVLLSPSCFWTRQTPPWPWICIACYALTRRRHEYHTACDRRRRHWRSGGRPGPPESRPGLARHRHRTAHGGAGRDDRERSPARHPEGAWLLWYRPGVGGQRLRTDLRRPAATRRAGRGHPRPPPGLHRRDHPVLAGLAGWRFRHHAGLAAHRPRDPGRRRRHRRPDGTIPGRHHVPGGAAAQPGDGRLRRDEYRRRRSRPAGRRPAHHVSVLALGAVRQRPDRRGGRPDGAAGVRGDRLAATAGSTCPARSPARWAWRPWSTA